MNKNHELKTWPEYFRAVKNKTKNFEVRKFVEAGLVSHFVELDGNETKVLGEGWAHPVVVGGVIDRLAAYEDTGLTPEQVQELAQAKADGWLVVLPCKIGEKVYRYCNDAINEGTIINILLNVKTGEIGLEYEMPTCYTCSRSGTLGKNLFLTREEAEKALAGGPGQLYRGD